MSDLDDLDQLLADIDAPAAGGAKQAGSPQDGKASASARSAAGSDGLAERLAKLQEQGDMMKDLLASDNEEDADAGADGAEAGDLDKLLGQAGKAIDEGAAATDIRVVLTSLAATDTKSVVINNSL